MFLLIENQITILFFVIYNLEVDHFFKLLLFHLPGGDVLNVETCSKASIIYTIILLYDGSSMSKYIMFILLFNIINIDAILLKQLNHIYFS